MGFGKNFENIITSSDLFTRLENKTQMIRNENNENLYHNRKTHTKEVRQCCVDIEKFILGKKEFEGIEVDRDILIASALLHDIGHTPYGHAGEEKINDKFVTDDGSHYSDSQPGLFKHNINSLKLIGEHLKMFCESFSLMDGILKHTSPFPKNYCLSVFKEHNIVKSNFILRYFNNAILDNIDDFISLLYETNACPLKSPLPVEGFMDCHVCSANNSCFAYCFKCSLFENKMSAYICYPYALTYEGAILYYADEISCFCSDLLDFYRYVKKAEKEQITSIPLTKLKSAISNIAAMYCGRELVDDLQKYKGLFDKEIDFTSNIPESIVGSVREHLIKAIEKSPNVLAKGAVKISYDGKKCRPLLCLNEHAKTVMSNIKAAIYKDLHSIAKIKQKNEDGKALIDSLINYYWNNFDDYLSDFKLVNGKSATSVCAKAIAKVTGLSYKTIDPFFDNKGKKRGMIETLFPSNQWNEGIFIKDETKRTLAKNILKREIGYFVASLSEDMCVQLKGAYNL